MEDFFVIPIVDMDPNWSLRGFHHDFYALEYCEEVLDIPSDHLDDANLSEKGLEINLIDFEDMIEEDWYIQLRRISKYVHTS